MVEMKKARLAERLTKAQEKQTLLDQISLETDAKRIKKMTGKQLDQQIDKLRAIWGKKIKVPIKSLRVEPKKEAVQEAVKEHIKLVEWEGGVPIVDLISRLSESIKLTAEAWHDEEDAEMDIDSD